MREGLKAGIWRLADPKISLASFASIALGAMAAAADGPISPPWLAATVLGIFALEVAKNASGELFDHETDRRVSPEDRSPFSGGKRVLIEGLLTRAETRAIAAVGYAVGVAAGLLIVAVRAPGVLWLGLVGVALAFFYNAPPVRLAYRGLGELAVGTCYGPLIAGGTYLVQRGDAPAEVWLAAIPLGALVAAFLWINEFPDYRADARAGKRNLVVRLGRRTAARAFAILVGVTFLVLAALPLAGVPVAVWLGGVAALPAALAVRAALRHPEETAKIVPAQARTLLAFLLYALGAGVGLLIA